MRFCYVGRKAFDDNGVGASLLELINGLGQVHDFRSSPNGSGSQDDDLVRELSQSDFDCYVFWESEHVAARLLPMGLNRFVIASRCEEACARPASFWRQFIDAQFLSF